MAQSLPGFWKPVGELALEGRFEARCGELLGQACVKVEDWQEVVTQLEAFAKPFSETLVESAQRRHLVEYVSGLLSTLERKTSEGIAYLHGRVRKQLPQFIGESPWEHAPLEYFWNWSSVRMTPEPGVRNTNFH